MLKVRCGALSDRLSVARAVRVIGCDGSGSMLDVVAALEWVHAHMQAPAVVLMSLGGPAAQIFDDACASLAAAGATIVVAAGNSAAGAVRVIFVVTEPAGPKPPWP